MMDNFRHLIIYRGYRGIYPLWVQHKERYVESLISCQRYRTQKDIYSLQFALFLKISQPAVSLAG